MFSGETKIQATTRPDNLWPEAWSSVGKAAQKKAKQAWANEKPKLEDARRLRGIYLNDAEDGDFKATVENARKELEVPMEAAMVCKTEDDQASQQVAGKKTAKNPRIQQTPPHQKWRLMSPRDNVRNHLYQKIMMITSRGKGYNSMTHYNLVHKFILMPQAMKIPDAKSCRGQGMEKARDKSSMEFGKK